MWYALRSVVVATSVSQTDLVMSGSLDPCCGAEAVASHTSTSRNAHHGIDDNMAFGRLVPLLVNGAPSSFSRARPPPFKGLPFFV